MKLQKNKTIIIFFLTLLSALTKMFVFLLLLFIF